MHTSALGAAFAGRVVLITGASSGLGEAMAEMLAAAGAKLGLVARRRELLDALRERLVQRHGDESHVEIAAADVGDREATLAAVQHLAARLGPVEVLIANAGVGAGMPARSFDSRKARIVYDVNVMGALHAIEAVLPSMLAAGRGQIVGMSSLASYRSYPETHTYCASKAALSAHLEGLRLELKPYGIAVTTICPGFVRTPMTAVNTFRMPWLMDANKASGRILEAIAAKRAVYNFPRRLYWLIRLSRLLPEAVVARATRPKPGQPHKGAASESL